MNKIYKTFNQFLIENNYDPDSYDILLAHHAWKSRQVEINELKEIIELLLLRCDKNLAINDDYSEIIESVEKVI